MQKNKLKRILIKEAKESHYLAFPYNITHDLWFIFQARLLKSTYIGSFFMLSVRIFQYLIVITIIQFLQR